MQENVNREQSKAVQSIAAFPNVEQNAVHESDSKTVFLVSPNDFPTELRGIIANVEDVMEKNYLLFSPPPNAFISHTI